MRPITRRIARPACRVTLWAGGSNIVLVTGVMREPDVGVWLDPMIQEAHLAAVARQLEEVILDIRPLEYANAAFWRCLVGWLKLLREDPAARYRLRIVPEPQHRWQLIAVPTLKVFGADRVVFDGLPA